MALVSSVTPKESSFYFMEYMSTELVGLIVDRSRMVGENEPPFSHYDSIDKLLQFANGMRHMHQQGVVHCDLKSENVLMSEVAVSDNEKHFLVKVADFGSARNFGHSRTMSSGFEAGGITYRYAAPEALQQLHNKEFIQDDELIYFVERCWHSYPSKRSSLVKICKDLNKAKVRILEKMSQSYSSPSQANSVNGPSSAPEVSSEGRCDVNPQVLENKRAWISASSCGIDHRFKSSGKFIVTVLLVMLAFMCLSSPIKEWRVADRFKPFMALVLFASILYLIFWNFCGGEFLFDTRCRIRTFRAVIFKEKVKIE